MDSSCSTVSWSENIIRRVAGAMILGSVLLGWQVHPGWYGLAVFVGLNLLQSSFSGICPLEMMLRRFDPTRQSATSS
ncbi:DUF2892 domain-containing protein [bacterium]|nr:MAG: DUF2892 domain-containing protein [bacterium]RKZ15287.1 MAG: DUF2892 domain-containing protein [bacterium]